MSVELKVPALGESITQAVVGQWHKRIGDVVSQDEPLVVLETDKVTIDVQAPAAGALTSIAHASGETVNIGDVLGLIDTSAAATVPARREAASPAPMGEPEAARATPVAKAVAVERGVSLATIQGSGAQGRVMKDDVMKATLASESAEGSSQRGLDSARPERHSAHPEQHSAHPEQHSAHPEQHSAHPEQHSARPEQHSARPERHSARPELVEGPQLNGSAAPAVAGVVPSVSRGEERVKMTVLRKRVAERLLEAQARAAILTTFNEVDMSQVMRLRKDYGERFEKKHGIKLGFMSFFIRAAVEALQAFPAVNAFIDGEDIVFHDYCDIGIAVSGSRGLVVPVIRDAEDKSLAELEKTIADFGQRARSDKLQLSDLKGGTFTISNGGIFGSMLSTPILNPPQTGILGMHNIVDRPVVRDGAIVIRPMMYVALSYDHRLIDGREAVQFLVRIKECIEAPERMLLEV